ncbi:MAG TPA: DUF389 domain-containing protein [Candidatus Chromulinivoraceae bacterium]|nr:DUF389 domain-containing protein [Candidatus Chromulinivoraceae bacterium]
MSLLYERKKLSQAVKRRRIIEFVENSRPDGDYYKLLVGAILVAIGGILTDSIPVVIASMIIAPLATPILAISLGLVARDWRYAGRNIIVLIFSSLIAFVIGISVAMILKNDQVPDILISFNGNQVIAVMVAVVAGAIGASGVVRQKVASAALGVAIAVSLMPPLVATAVGLAPGGTPFAGSLTLYVLNIIGIVVAGTIVFGLLGLGRTYRSIKK